MNTKTTTTVRASIAWVAFAAAACVPCVADTLKWTDAYLERPKTQDQWATIVSMADGGNARAQFYVVRIRQKEANIETTTPERREELRQKASKHLILSANQKYPAAQYLLGSFMLNPEGFGRIKVNEMAAFQLIHEAASQGLPDAMFQLCQIYKEGLRGAGVRENKIQAMKWRILADRFGFDKLQSAQIYVAAFQPMSPAEVEEACNAAKAFAPKQVFKGDLSFPSARTIDYDSLIDTARQFSNPTKP